MCRRAQTVDFAMSVEDDLRQILSQPDLPTLDGVVVAGGHMTAELLTLAYDNGIFPWPHEGYPLLWFSPDERGVLDFEKLHLPRSFKKWRRSVASQYRISFNENFSAVVRHCRDQKRKGQIGSWINDEIESVYAEMHRLRRAFSVEIWREKNLVGGLYGVKSEKYYSCESMFCSEKNTSKLALVSLVEMLQSQGAEWVDIQMVTPVCESFGGRLISRTDFLCRIGHSDHLRK